MRFILLVNVFLRFVSASFLCSILLFLLARQLFVTLSLFLFVISPCILATKNPNIFHISFWIYRIYECLALVYSRFSSNGSHCVALQQKWQITILRGIRTATQTYQLDVSLFSAATQLLTVFQSEIFWRRDFDSVHQNKGGVCQNNCVIMLKNDAYRYFCYHGECDNQRHAAFQTEYYSLPKLWYSGHFLSACKYSSRRSVSFLHSLCHCILFFSFSSLVCAPSQFHIFPLFGFWYWKHLLCTMLTLLSFDTHRYREWMRQTTTTTAKLYIYNIHAGKQFIARQKSMCNNCEIPILSILYNVHSTLNVREILRQSFATKMNYCLCVEPGGPMEKKCRIFAKIEMDLQQQ